MKHVLVELPEPTGECDESALVRVHTEQGEVFDAYYDHDELFRGWYIDDGEKKISGVEYWEPLIKNR